MRLFKGFLKTLLFSSLSFNLLTKESETNEVGNWYQKLHWLKKAKPKSQEIMILVKNIKQYKNDFVTKRSIILSSVRELFESLQIDQESLDVRISKFIADLEAKIEEGYNTEEEQAEIEKLTENKKNLERLKIDFKLIEDLKEKVEEATLDVLPTEIQTSEGYGERALERLEELDASFDDRKAKKLYEEIQNIYDNVNAIDSYIEGPLKGYLNQLSIRSNQLINEVKSLVTQLNNQGIFISEKVEEISKPKIQEEAEKAKVKEPKKEVPLSIFGRIFSFFANLVKTIWYVLTYPFAWLFRNKA